jgi:hypothetical protein
MLKLFALAGTALCVALFAVSLIHGLNAADELVFPFRHLVDGDSWIQYGIGTVVGLTFFVLGARNGRRSS